jgi:hypothetical protein
VTTILTSVGTSLATAIAAIFLGVRWVGDLARDQVNQATQAAHTRAVESARAELNKDLEGAKAEHARELEQVRSQLGAALELLKADVTERRDLINATTGALAHGFSASHTRVMDAQAELWRTVLAVRKDTGQYLGVYDLLYPVELTKPGPAATKAVALVPATPEMAFHERYTQIISIEHLRPLVGENLWRLFWVYRAVAGNITYHVIKGRDLGALPRWWDFDEKGRPNQHAESLLLTVFSVDELTALRDPPTGSLSRILDALEVRMLTIMNEWLTGRRLVDESFEQQQRVATLLREVRTLDERRVAPSA